MFIDFISNEISSFLRFCLSGTVDLVLGLTCSKSKNLKEHGYEIISTDVNTF